MFAGPDLPGDAAAGQGGGRELPVCGDAVQGGAALCAVAPGAPDPERETAPHRRREVRVCRGRMHALRLGRRWETAVAALAPRKAEGFLLHARAGRWSLNCSRHQQAVRIGALYERTLLRPMTTAAWHALQTRVRAARALYCRGPSPGGGAPCHSWCRAARALTGGEGAGLRRRSGSGSGRCATTSCCDRVCRGPVSRRFCARSSPRSRRVAPQLPPLPRRRCRAAERSSREGRGGGAGRGKAGGALMRAWTGGALTGFAGRGVLGA